jgi:5'-nucleotidase
MKILVANDDGILASGLALLAEACQAVAEVTVVAPDREQSGTSHSLTMHRPIRPTRRADGSYQVDGTPTDCVLLALGALMPERPDFVFSGVNHGPNMGEDVLYSGTVAAAMEGVALGVPSIAVSFAGPASDLATLGSYRDLLTALVQRITRIDHFPVETLLNINLPACGAAGVQGTRVTSLGSRYFSESLSRMKDPWGREMFWIGGGSIHWTGGAETDHHAVANNFISITPLHMDLTNYALMETVRGWSLEG